MQSASVYSQTQTKKMKFPLFFVLFSLAVALFLTNVHGEDLGDSVIKPEEGELDEFFSMQPFLSDPENNSTDTAGPLKPYLTCIRVVCPKNCITCVCKCIRWR